MTLLMLQMVFVHCIMLALALLGLTWQVSLTWHGFTFLLQQGYLLEGLQLMTCLTCVMVNRVAVNTLPPRNIIQESC